MAASMDCAMQAEALLSSDDQHNVTNNLHNEQQIPIQGKSIQSDLIIKGPKIYSDAAFWTSKIPGALRGQVGTGIGIYFSLPADHGELNIQIQASTPVTIDPIQAEATALACAAMLANFLNVQQPTFLTDCLPLASAVASKNISYPATPWNIRNYLASFIKSYTNLNAQVFHISRNLNGVAHNLAQQVYQSVRGPILDCSSHSHASDDCPVSAILGDFNFSGFQVHKVYCF